MSQFISLLIGGLFLGAIYSLVALGFVTVFKATHVINFAQGSVLLLGAFVIGRTHGSLGFWGAVMLGIAAAALVALLIDAVLIRPVRRADLGTLAILTLGVDILLATELTREIGTDVLSVGAPWGSDVVEVAGIRVAESRVIAGGVAAVLVAAFAAVFKFTDWGIAMRSAAEDGETASLMGIRLNRVAAAAWAMAGALAAIGGLFLTSFPAAGVTGGVGLVAGVGGVLFLARAGSARRDIDAAAAAHEPWTDALADRDASGRRDAKIGVIALGAGAACLLTGGALLVLGLRRTEVVPAVSSSGASLSLRGQF